ncbi:MAG: hypothetical protein M1834_003654 [Cirrosporium novae-zelandiae]|nr:MAG: hypothetical protein M1834_003654 [Cirrosporium novae-zelandiae]
MAEAFVALGIAANIAQFVGYGIQLISEGKEKYDSVNGTRDKDHELKITVQSIKTFSYELKTTASRPGVSTRRDSSDERAIQQLAEECQLLADDLLRVLNDLKVSKDVRFRGLQTVRQMIRSVRKRKDIRKLKTKLLNIDKQLRDKVFSMLQKNNHSDVFLAIDRINETNRRISRNTDLRLDELKTDIINALSEQENATTKADIPFDNISRKLESLEAYICDHNTILEALRRWAGSQKLVTASYFFWNSGLPIQSSQSGLLQSLLYQVLLACPDLIESVYSTHCPTAPWVRSELLETLNEVSKQTLLPAKFCFFVDGIDEFDGDDEIIIGLLKGLADSPNIKICISSRPWATFLGAFNDCRWKLVLQDHTKHDMREYVHNMLVENEAFIKAANQDLRCNSLVSEIVQRANGVWLWVYLVVRDLLRDFKAEEGYDFLLRRLESFPEEVENAHREESSMIFLIAVEVVRPLPILALEYLEMERKDPEYALKLKIAPMSLEKAPESAITTKKIQLHRRCRDLLEVNINFSIHTFLKYRIHFLHRTVRDFLRDNYQAELQKHAPKKFDTRTSLCNILLAFIKVLPIPKSFQLASYQFLSLGVESMGYAREMEYKSNTPNIALLDEFGRVNTAHATKIWTDTNHLIRSLTRSQHEHLVQIIQGGLRLYMHEKLKASPGILQENHARPLLDYALGPMRRPPMENSYEIPPLGPRIDVPIVSSLLSCGSDPNEEVQSFPSQTVWSAFLLSCYYNREMVSDDCKDSWYEAVKLLINHGANPKILVDVQVCPPLNESETIEQYEQTVYIEIASNYLTVSEILQWTFPNDQAARLEARMIDYAQQHQPSIFQRIFRWR